MKETRSYNPRDVLEMDRLNVFDRLDWEDYRDHSISLLIDMYPENDVIHEWNQLERYVEEGVITRETIVNIVDTALGRTNDGPDK